MSRITVICHRCGKSTMVDLSKTLSDQRCRACRGFLQGVDVSYGDKQPEGLRRKLVMRTIGHGAREPDWVDQEEPVIPVRSRWPMFFRSVVWISSVTFTAILIKVLIQKSQSKGDAHKLQLEQEVPQVDVRVTAPWRNRATAVAKRALKAQTVSELLPFLYHPEVDEEVIRRYYATEEKLPLGTDLIDEYYIPEEKGNEKVVAFDFTDLAKRRRIFVVVETPDGMFIDWPSLVGFGEMSLKQYLGTAPEGVVIMRARARLGDYYNNHFSDSKRWICVRLCDVIDENVVYAYFDRHAPGADAVAGLPDPAGKVPRADVPVIVALRHPKGNPHKDQTEIVSFLASTWYLPEGLKPLIEQSRKLDAIKSAIPGSETPPDKTAPPQDSPQAPAPAPQPPK